MWAYDSTFYQIYPLGFAGAPRENDGVPAHRIRRVMDFSAHIAALGANAVYFSPVFESDRHGYDTRDYCKIDCRLGDDDDFRAVCEDLHAKGIRVVLDGVFNHVGRGFWAFQDVLAHRENSPYKDWFHIDFGGDNGYHDGLWYEGWEGHFELVKLNLRNPDVVRHLLDAVRSWVERFDIDGLRLDVAYCLDRDFLRALRRFTDGLKPDFFLLGEMLHGDYNQLVNDEMLHSVTNYECYKGIYSSLNSLNLCEIGYSLDRQFGPAPWTLYKGKHLFNFVDNHDVPRIASILTDKRQLPLAYGLLFGMPGIPCIYYGSEWGIYGEKAAGDDALRPALEAPQENELTEQIRTLATARSASLALRMGDYQELFRGNRQLVFARRAPGETVVVACNIDENPCFVRFDAGAAGGTDLISGGKVSFSGGAELPAHSVFFWRTE